VPQLASSQSWAEHGLDTGVENLCSAPRYLDLLRMKGIAYDVVPRNWTDLTPRNQTRVWLRIQVQPLSGKRLFLRTSGFPSRRRFRIVREAEARQNQSSTAHPACLVPI